MARKTSRVSHQGERSRERILDATMRIAALRGYEGTTLTQVVKATGLPASSIYWHFRNKDELLAEVLEYSYRRWQAVAGYADDTDPGPWHARMFLSFERVRERLTRRPEYWLMGLMLTLGRHNGGSPARDRFLRIRGESIGRMSQRWEHILGDDVIAAEPRLPGVLSRLALAGLDGLFLAQQTDDRWDLDLLLWTLAHGLEAVAHRLLADPDGTMPFTGDEDAAGTGTDTMAGTGAGTGADGATRDSATSPDTTPRQPPRQTPRQTPPQTPRRLAPIDPATLDPTASVLMTGTPEAPTLGGSAPSGDASPEDGGARPSGRERILLAAAEVAAEHGYQGTTISRVCKRAGLPGSSLYWFFKDKDAMLAAVVAHSYEEWRSRQFVPGPVPPGASWGDTLRGALMDSWAALVDNPNFLRLGYLLLLERREKSPTARDMFQRIRHHTLGLYTDWFANALPAELTSERPELPANLARLMMALSDGLLVSYQVDQPPWDPRRFTDLAVTMLEAGTRRPPAPAPSPGQTRERNTARHPG